MPRKELIGANKVSDVSFLPHIRKRIKGRSAGLSYIEEVTYSTIESSFEIPAGEDIPNNTLCKIVDGIAYIADGGAECFAVKGGVQGSIITCIFFGEVDYTLPDGQLYNNFDGTVTTILPNTVGVQIVGTRLNDDKIFINLGTFYAYE